MAVTVHPHACGEYVIRSGGIRVAVGSPPRVWGIPVAIDPIPHTHRFTPTRVGNTAAEKVPSKALVGSPPRVWGIRDLVVQLVAVFGFTPTRVGNTEFSTPPKNPSPVHPHACGEY